MLVGLFFTWQQFQTNREQLSEQLDLTRRAQVADRFTQAVGQLSSGKLETQLGGIYGLEQVARDSPDQQRLVVFEVLTAYVRKHSPWPPDPHSQPAKDTPITKIPDMSVRAADVQAAMTVLGRRNIKEHDPPLDLYSIDLRGASLDGAQLQGANLFRAQLQGASLDGANLQYAHLIDTQLQYANLSGAQLQHVNTIGAQLQYALLSGAQLQHARLQDAQLQHAWLIGAQLQGANLGDANLKHALLGGAQLQGANLGGANLKHVLLGTTQLQGATATKQTQWPSGFDWREAGVKIQRI